MPRPILIDAPAPVTTHVVFASPHSGRVYPAALTGRARVSGTVLRSSEDAYVDLLLATAPRHGAPLVTTEVPRAFVDFNRDETELDPALITGVPRAGTLSPRVASGLGVVARVVAQGEPIYRGRLTLAEVEDRLHRYWRPYHAGLGALLDAQCARFGQVLLVDVHSMPRAALLGYTASRGGRPEVVLGDRHGAACRPGVLDAIEGIFRAEGLRVARNIPFAGAYVAARYGRPDQGRDVVQIEIDRGLYLDEPRIEPGPDFAAFRATMDRVVAAIAMLGQAGAMPLAAE